MGIIHIIRFLRGYVRFEIRDGFIERFINLCAQGGVPLWEGFRSGDSYVAYTTTKGSRMLADFAAKTGVTLEMEPVHGVRALAKRYRKRAGLYTGFIILIGALVAASCFIWRVEIHGNEAIPSTEILTVLEELGVKPGTLRSNVDTRDVERRMILKLDRLSWVAVNLKGSIAQIEVKERILPPDPIGDDTPHNIVATKTGYISYMEIYEGQPAVKVGDSVQAGDILVSGIMEDKSGRNRTVHARGKVIAQTELTLSQNIAFLQEEYTARQVKIRRFINIGPVDLPLFWATEVNSPYKLESATYPVPLVGNFLPLSYTKENYIIYERHETLLSAEQAKIVAEKNLEELEQKTFEGKRVILREYNGQELPDGFLLEGRYIYEEDIGEEREIL